MSARSKKKWPWDLAWALVLVGWVTYATVIGRAHLHFYLLLCAWLGGLCCYVTANTFISARRRGVNNRRLPWKKLDY